MADTDNDKDHVVAAGENADAGEKKHRSKKHKDGDAEGGEKKKHRSKKDKDGTSTGDAEGGEKKKKHRSKKDKDGTTTGDAEGGEKKKKHRSKKDKDGTTTGDAEGGEKKKKHRSKKSSSSSSKKDKKDDESMSEPDEGDERTIEEKYDVGRELGRGAFSVVKECTSKRSGRKYAVKIIEKQNAGQDIARLRTEMEILKSVKHPNIIALKEIIEDDKTLYIITELVTGGELFDKIVELGAYTEADAAQLVSKMVSAIDYLHNMNIVHRDLKPENLLLKSEADVSEIKLADFGLSKIVGQKVMMQTACGTPGYVAPEVLSATGYDKEVDLWSIGVITYILLCGFPPFYNENLPLLFEQIMKAEYDFPPDYWDEISEAAKDFITKLLVVEPKKRMTAKQALEHPWLAGAAPKHKLNVKSKMEQHVAKYREGSKANIK